MKTLRECLVDYDTTLLRAIAERLGVELATSHQQGMVEVIAVTLLEAGFVAEVLTWLSDEERRAMDALMANGGRMRVHISRCGSERSGDSAREVWPERLPGAHPSVPPKGCGTAV